MAEDTYSVPSPKIDPTRRQARRPDGTPDDNDRTEIGPTELAFAEWKKLGIQAPNLDALREYRLARVRAELVRHDYAGILLWDPLNIRYATDASNMQVWTTHNQARACFVPTQGPITLFEYPQAMHVLDYLPLVERRERAISFFYFTSGNRTPEMAERFAARIDSLLRETGGGNRRLAVDKIEIAGLRALDNLKVDVQSGQEVMEHARAIKDENELNAMRCAVSACEAAMHAMQKALEPGMTESDVWAVLHAENIRRGGEWIETRLLCSGPRTNPWFQECGPRVIQEGDIVAFDTDLIGPYGYCSDISRSWICGDVRPTNEQRTLYQVAKEHIDRNRELVEPGMKFFDLSRKSHRLPDEYKALRYGVIAHGVGLCDEYPSIKYPEFLEKFGYDGTLEPGMTICVEAYVGAEGGSCGIKLEDQVVITETGCESISHYPFESAFLD